MNPNRTSSGGMASLRLLLQQRSRLLLALAIPVGVLLVVLLRGDLDKFGQNRWGAPQIRIAIPPPVAPPGAPPVTDVRYQDIAPETAAAINNAVPLQSVGPAARPFVVDAGSPAWDKAVQCLAQAIYYEAATEPKDGKRGVAQVILNRLRSPAFPNSVCGVVYQGSDRPTGCQFTFTCDGSLNRPPSPALWSEARKIAIEALKGYVFKPVGHATHYHANYVVPYWSSSMAKIAVVGLHNFYRWPGSWRPSTYFYQRYANIEPDVGIAKAAASEIPSALASDPGIMPQSLTPPPGQGLTAKANAANRTSLAEDQTTHTLSAGASKPELNERLLKQEKPAADLQAHQFKPLP